MKLSLVKRCQFLPKQMGLLSTENRNGLAQGACNNVKAPSSGFGETVADTARSGGMRECGSRRAIRNGPEGRLFGSPKVELSHDNESR